MSMAIHSLLKWKRWSCSSRAVAVLRATSLL